MRKNVYLVITWDRKVLVIEKGDCWDLFGGKPEIGESETGFLFRQLKEKVSGLKIKDFKSYGYINGKTLFQWRAINARIYIAKAVSGFEDNVGIKWIKNSAECRLSKISKRIFYFIKNEGCL